MYVVYILKSIKDNTYYVGYTNDLIQRLKVHNEGKCRYTKGHLPYEVVYSEEYDNMLDAKKREAYIKSLRNTVRFLKNVRRDARVV